MQTNQNVMKKSFFALAFTVLVIFSSCSSSENKDSQEEGKNPDSEDVVLRMLYSEWPPDMIAYLAQEKGFFEENGVNVELVWVSGYDENLEKRQNGETDIWNYTLLDLVTEYSNGTTENGQVFLIEDFSFGADAVIAGPEGEITEVTDLAGKNVGVETGTIGEFFLSIALEKEGLVLEDVVIVEAAADSVPEMLENGEIDAGVTYEPFISEAVNAGAATVVVDSAQERGTIVDVYVANSDHIAENSEAYTRLARALLEAGEYFENNKQEAAEIMKDPLGLTTEEVLETFETFEIPDLRANQTTFDRNSGFASLHNLAKLAQQYLDDQGALEADFDVDDLINSEIVSSL